MNDQFLRDLRRAPTPAFARRLRASLDDDSGRESRGAVRYLRRWAPLVASVTIVSIAFTFPSVRAGAQAFLDLFRVANVVGISFNANQLRNISDSGLDLPALLGGSVEPSTPADPVVVETADEAASLAGIEVIEPAWTPVNLELQEIQVIGAQSALFKPSTANLELVLDALGIADLTVPAGLDEGDVSVAIPPVVRLLFSDPDGEKVEFMQAGSPEITMPAGLDLPVLAEIALRIIGLDREEAFRLAWAIDWRSTLIIPVPAGEATFEEVEIGGDKGVAVLPNDDDLGILLWANGNRVYSLSGSLPLPELLEMAQTAQ